MLRGVLNCHIQKKQTQPCTYRTYYVAVKRGIWLILSTTIVVGSSLIPWGRIEYTQS